ncbi:MAG: NAD(P)-dependent oxidoreductase [Burkholderiaceae bacterium]
MPTTVAMHEHSYQHISERLNALDLDISVIPFNDAGEFLVEDQPVAAKDISVDYAWLSVHTSSDAIRESAFETLLACRRVGVLQTFNAGLDNPFYKQISAKGTVVCNSSAQAVAISEYVLAQSLAAIHPVDQQRQQQRANLWQRTPFRELSRMNWLIVGFGPIGQAINKRVKAFGATTTIIRRTPTPSDAIDQVGTLNDLTTHLPNADVIVLACPLNKTTRNMADTAFFSHVKTGALLINIARGGLVNDQALINALDGGQLGLAVLDVFHQEPLPTEHPLWSHPKVRLTPHTSFNGDGVHDRWDQLFLDNIQRQVNGESLTHIVSPEDLAAT